MLLATELAAGSDDAGVEDAGIDEAGIDDAGIDDAGVDEAGVDEAATDAGALELTAELEVGFFLLSLPPQATKDADSAIIKLMFFTIIL
jgi:hypothetical protein